MRQHMAMWREDCQAGSIHHVVSTTPAGREADDGGTQQGTTLCECLFAVSMFSVGFQTAMQHRPLEGWVVTLQGCPYQGNVVWHFQLPYC